MLCLVYDAGLYDYCCPTELIVFLCTNVPSAAIVCFLNKGFFVFLLRFVRSIRKKLFVHGRREFYLIKTKLFVDKKY